MLSSKLRAAGDSTQDGEPTCLCALSGESLKLPLIDCDLEGESTHDDVSPPTAGGLFIGDR